MHCKEAIHVTEKLGLSKAIKEVHPSNNHYSYIPLFLSKRLPLCVIGTCASCSMCYVLLAFYGIGFDCGTHWPRHKDPWYIMMI